MLSITLRVATVVHLALAIALTAAGMCEPSKPWADLIARMVLWPTLALLSWALADIVESAPPATD